MDKTLTFDAGVHNSIPRGGLCKGFVLLCCFFPAVIDFLVLFW